MQINTLILGAGAAGMMAAARSGPSTLVIDHARSPGEKIRISGGGRCNFTNLYAGPENFIGQNPHFHKSALARYTQWDFIELMAAHNIAWHEKTLGQLFCDGKATQIVDMLRSEVVASGGDLWLNTALRDLTHADGLFTARLERDGVAQQVTARHLIVATGGKSIPKMGATGLAYDIARQFDHDVTETRPALVPLTFPDGRFSSLSGLSLPVTATCNGTSFDEALLFTHRGLSGPSILQISSYWRDGDAISLDLCPSNSLYDTLRAERATSGKRSLKRVLSTYLPARLTDHLSDTLPLSGNLADQSDAALKTLTTQLHHWSLTPTGSEGYRTAEVTLGGISTSQIDSRTMMSKHLPGLYFIGEAVDVTGWLGGFNFQWAWSSAVAAGSHICP